AHNRPRPHNSAHAFPWHPLETGRFSRPARGVRYAPAAWHVGAIQPRVLLVTVAALVMLDARAAVAHCTSATVTPTSVSVPSTGSTSAVSVITGTSCSWTAVSTVS